MTAVWREAPQREYKPRDPSVTSRMMSAVRATDSKAEMIIRRELWHRGVRYRVHHKGLAGKPDLVFVAAKVAVFIDGDFWHARTLVQEGEQALRALLRTERKDWWVAKLRRNAERDREVTAALEADGWLVLRYWESAVKQFPIEVADEVAQMVSERKRRKS